MSGLDDIPGYDDLGEWGDRLDAAQASIAPGDAQAAYREALQAINADGTLDGQPGLQQQARDLAADLRDSQQDADHAAGTKEALESTYEEFQSDVREEASEGSGGEYRNGNNESNDDALSGQRDEVDRRVDATTAAAETSTDDALGGGALTSWARASSALVTQAPPAPTQSGGQSRSGGGHGSDLGYGLTVGDLRTASAAVQTCLDEYQGAALGVAREVRDSAGEAVDHHEPDQLADVNQFGQFVLTVMVQLNSLGQGLRGLKGLTDQTLTNYQDNDQDAAAGMSRGAA